jgi:methyl-accepting chemotaxis protein
VAVNQLDQMTQQNAALVEESAAAAESLKDQAHRLAQVVQVFRISSDASQAGSAVRGVPAPTAVARIAPQPTQTRAVPAVTKPATIALKRPALASKTASHSAPSSSPKPVAASGAEGDWESF